MNQRLLATASLAIVTCVLLLATGCKGGRHYDEDGNPINETPTGGSNVRWLGASGSTFIAPLIDRWDSDYGKSHLLHINYRPIGSGGGLDELRKGYGAFAATDSPFNDEQLQVLPPIVQFPVTAGPVSIPYNLPGLNAPLKLSGTTLAEIYSGAIVSWQDPAIARDNPGLGLPHAAIIVVHRSDGSGTTSIVTNYLSMVSPTWKTKYGQGLTANWPVGIGGNGSSAVLNIVKGSVGAIGCAELAFAKNAGLPVASIQNRAGEFVAPSPESASLAVNAAVDVLAKDLRTPIVDPPATAKGAYPITGLSFISIRKDSKGLEGDQAALRDYIAYALTTGQDVAEQLGYAKLPPPIQHQGQALLSQLTENGKPIQ